VRLKRSYNIVYLISSDYLIFDNSYSWAVAKTLYYEIDVYTDDDSSPAVEVTSS